MASVSVSLIAPLLANPPPTRMASFSYDITLSSLYVSEVAPLPPSYCGSFSVYTDGGGGGSGGAAEVAT